MLVPLVPLVILLSFVTWQNNVQQLERANESAENYALVASGYQTELIVDLRQLLSIIVEGADYRGGGDVCKRSLNRIFARLSNYSSIAVTDKNGTIVCNTGDPSSVNLSDRSYFQLARKSMQFTLSELLEGKVSHAQVIVGAMPWADKNGDFGGMAVASIDAQRFASSVQDMPLPIGSEYYVLDRAGKVVAQSGQMPDDLRARLADLPLLEKKPQSFMLRDGKVTRTYTAIAVDNGALTVLIGIPRRFFFSISAGNLLIGLLGPITMLAVSILLIWYLGNRLVTAPVTGLIRVARAYSKGDLLARPPISVGGGEFRELSTTFTEMADRILTREQDLQEAIQRREMMLREIHHRVKNNLQIVISLVNLQSKSVSLPAAQEAFTEIQTRMRALALVHRYLYESEDLQSVNIGSFLTELCSSLQQAYGVSPARIAIEVKTDPVYEIIDRAVPLALFMTETISNALRHAFPSNRPGYVHVSLKLLEGTNASFSVEDNGVGIDSTEPESVADGIFRAAKPQTGLGMSLAKAFARQIDGDLTISGPPGTMVSLIFKSKPAPSAL